MFIANNKEIKTQQFLNATVCVHETLCYSIHTTTRNEMRSSGDLNLHLCLWSFSGSMVVLAVEIGGSISGGNESRFDVFV